MTMAQNALEAIQGPQSFPIRVVEGLRRRWIQLQEWDAAHTRFILNGLERRNRTSRSPVAGGPGPVVSLTTHGNRVHGVHLTIESIGRGKLRPSRLILWLDNERVFANLPDALRRLRDRGLEIHLTENFGPHTKYYPFLEASESFSSALVTADDDVVYPRYWLKRLAHAYAKDPSVVHCYRAHRIRLEESWVAPYLSWDRCYSTQPSFQNFATGVSGCIYPPDFLRFLKDAGRRFTAVCPKADDVWLHVNALRAGVRIRQLRPWQYTFLMLPGTQDIALQLQNVIGLQNDIQIRRTYSVQDVSQIQAF